MKVLLTGANGFVGSHILDALQRRSIPVATLLRSSSNRRFIEAHLANLEVRTGALDNADSLRRALDGITHVLHCAGCTKALRISEFYAVNQTGTRLLVEAVNQRRHQIQRLLLLSSLAAAGPARPDAPAREDAPPRPVSEYGRSKLAGEEEVRNGCQTDYVILRPPAVYGPRDTEFLSLFRSVRAHLVPAGSAGRLPLSLVFARDLAEATVACLTHPDVTRKTFFVASPEIVSPRDIADEIARQMNMWTVPLPIPTPLLWPVCLAREALSQLTRIPDVLGRQKYAELRAPGWICSPSRLREVAGVECPTPLAAGLSETSAWYRRERWL